MPTTPTVGEAISEFVAATLTTALTGVKVERFRLRPYEANELPAVAITPNREEVEYGPGRKDVAPGAKRMFFFSVRISVPSDPADEGLDALRALVIAALMKDRSVGGLALGIGETNSEWEAEAGSDFTFGVLIIGFEVHYQTRADDARAQI
jgi:hypothetical protein